MPVQVRETSSQAAARTERAQRGKPAHWVHDKPNEFVNPWPSFRQAINGVGDGLKMLRTGLSISMNPPSKDDVGQIGSQKPDWAKLEAGARAGQITATWLGHACFLVELPVAGTAAKRGPRILFDPVFSDRCSPSQWIGPKRYTPPPCAIEEIPEVDAIVISHNHYDHMDTTTLKTLLSRPSAPHVFAPLGDGNTEYFASLGIPASRAHCLDWWDARRVSVSVSASSQSKDTDFEFDVTFTPGQHFTGRGLRDRFKTLWGGWVVEGVPVSDSPGKETTPKVYFAGDTGYRAVYSDTDDGPEDLPVCPAFKEIGERWGGFDLALIPIGAYAPRTYMSPVHCAPRDSVAIFKDIKARRGLGMHWGAWVLTTEHVLEPPKTLAEECTKAGVKEGVFGVCDIGETVGVVVGGDDV